MTKTIKLWFNPDYNLYFPKTPSDCQKLMDANWTNIPIFTPPGVIKPGINSITQLYGYLSIVPGGIQYTLRLSNYLPSHVTMTDHSHKTNNQSNQQET